MGRILPLQGTGQVPAAPQGAGSLEDALVPLAENGVFNKEFI